MKVQTEPMKQVMQDEFERYQKGLPVRDPCISIIFLRPYNTIGDMVKRKPEVKVEQCPSDFESFAVFGSFEVLLR